MKDMSLTAAEAKETMLCSPSDESDLPRYPYGLCLELNSETLEKLGITTLGIGTEVTIMARAKVTSVNQYEEQGGAENRISLQITEMDVATGASDNPSAASKLYGQNSA